MNQISMPRLIKGAFIAFSALALVAVGCGDDETKTSGTSNGGNPGTGGTTSNGGSPGTGGGAACMPEGDCETCAAEECPDEALACCQTAGCQDLLTCAATNCDPPDDLTCVSTNCPDELAAAGAPGIAAAQELGACLQPAIETSTKQSCQACNASLGSGGGGGAGGN